MIKKNILATFIILIINGCDKDHKKTIEELIDEGNLIELQDRRSNLIIEKGEINNELKKITEAVSMLDTIQSSVLVNELKIKSGQINHYSQFQGSIKTDQNMILYPEFSGRINNILVSEGQSVKKGQPLAKIDDGGLVNEFQLVKSQATLSKTLFERQSKLWSENIGSEIQYLESKTNYEIQQNRLESISESLKKTTITAPFDGTIDEIFIEEGMLVSPPMVAGQGSAFRIINLNKLYVEAVIPEKYLGKIKKGTEALVDIEILNSSFRSTIRHSVTSIDPNTRTFRIEISVPKNLMGLVPNMNVIVNILDYKNEDAILVPESIVSEDSENNNFLFLIVNGKAQKTIVKIGYSQDGLIEITDGLNIGDAVVNEGSRIVKNGQNVKIYGANE